MHHAGVYVFVHLIIVILKKYISAQIRIWK
jgi:hypothetical protein